jgi:CHASE3 domain sensor protein
MPNPESSWLHQYKTLNANLTQTMDALRKSTSDPRGVQNRELAFFSKSVMETYSCLLMVAAERVDDAVDAASETFEKSARDVSEMVNAIGLIVDASEKDLAHKIEAFTASTEKSSADLATSTRRLVAGTWFLGIAAITAAAIQAYVMWASPAQVIVMPAFRP